ncbi:MAG: hypothetical protein H7144_04675 [Burkholderiales bacterium]|nr:hypothetical protein [Phycisphaerae bacterium]
MNWKSVIVIVMAIGVSGLIAQSNRAEAEPPAAAGSVEARLAAIESYLHIGEPGKRESVAADDKTFDDLKASLIKLEQQQETLDRRARSTGGQTGAPGEKLTADLDAARRDIDAVRASIRAMEDRVRRLETRIR